jgi:hypothetical protein
LLPATNGLHVHISKGYDIFGENARKTLDRKLRV